MLKETTDIRSPRPFRSAELLCARPARHLASSFFKVRQRDKGWTGMLGKKRKGDLG